MDLTGTISIENSIGLTVQISEFNIKNDDFSAWIERFKLFMLLNKINTHKKKLMFLTLLDNDGYSLLRDLSIKVMIF
jgi:dimeric dUTPase (all-alpha-NTP-PPase superfamily)